MQVLIGLRPVACGTERTIVQEGVPDSVPVGFCCPGWQESLALLVEPTIPDGP